MKLDLQLRNLKTGETEQKPFESEEAAMAWLKERPQFTAVLGVASHHVPKEISDKLKNGCRPLDEEEIKLEKELAAAEEQARKRAEARRKAELAAAELHRKEMANADPNRPMEVRWTFDHGMSIADPADPRSITDEAREVVTAWVEERHEWVKGRGQVVGDAKVKVWPGPIPEGEGDNRVIQGTFIPVTAPADD